MASGCVCQQLENLIKKTVTKGLVVPGVQKKMSLHLSKEDNIPRLTIVNYPTGYICKPQSTEYPALDLAELFTRLVFCFLTGNSDMHLKNFSLIEDAPGNRHFVLSPAYDLLPVNVIVPADQEETALTLNGKKQNLTRNDFLKFAENIGVSAKAASKMIDKQLDHEEEALQAVAESYMPDDMKESMSKLITSRFKRLNRNIP